MDKRVLAQVLGKLRFSATLPEEVLDRLASFAVLRGFPDGTVLFREGDLSDSLMIISIGRVALDIHVPARGNTRILTLGPGDLIAWSALLGDGKMTTAAVAVEDTQVVIISANEVLSACATNRDFGYLFMRQVACALAERLHATRLQLLDLFSETTPQIPPAPVSPPVR